MADVPWYRAGRWWGTTDEERKASFPCDGVLPDHNDACYRAVGIDAEPATVFRWLCQLRAAPYSYDWIDNRGRTSPRELLPGLDELEVGQPVMTIFDIASFERDVHLTMRLRRPGLFPPMAVSYVAVPRPEGGCRLVVKLAMQYSTGLRDRLLAPLFPWMDLVMMRRQLLNLKRLAECGG